MVIVTHIISLFVIVVHIYQKILNIIMHDIGGKWIVISRTLLDTRKWGLWQHICPSIGVDIYVTITPPPPLDGVWQCV